VSRVKLWPGTRVRDADGSAHMDALRGRARAWPRPCRARSPAHLLVRLVGTAFGTGLPDSAIMSQGRCAHSDIRDPAAPHTCSPPLLTVLTGQAWAPAAMPGQLNAALRPPRRSPQHRSKQLVGHAAHNTSSPMLKSPFSISRSRRWPEVRVPGPSCRVRALPRLPGVPWRDGSGCQHPVKRSKRLGCTCISMA